MERGDPMEELARELANLFCCDVSAILPTLYDKARRNALAGNLKEIVNTTLFDRDAEKAARLYRAVREV